MASTVDPARLAQRRRVVGALAILAAAGSVALVAAWSGRERSAPVVIERGDTVEATEGNPIVAENERPGDEGWRIERDAGRDLEGYADRVSVRPGQRVTLYVSTTFPRYDVRVYRTGWYGGAGGRLVLEREGVSGREQDDVHVDPVTRMVEARWAPSVRFTVGDDWTTGAYLVKLEGPDGAASYVPFTVLESGRTAPILFQASVTTWQAYNAWGGASLYLGTAPGGGRSGALRSRVVSFDRPYDFGSGAADFLGLEYPLIAWLERNGYDVGYATNVDIHADAGLLEGRKAFLSLGHDEYWSREMRDAVEAATRRGTNLAFFGANAMFRKIRLTESPLGPHRREVNHRTTQGDPAAAIDPSDATVEWRYPPISEPEDELLGAMYECNPVSGDVKVYDPLPWLFEETGLDAGDVVEGILGSEYDRVWDTDTHPEPIWVLFRSPVTCRGERSVSDTTFARFDSGTAVFNAATSRFLCVFEPGCDGAEPDRRVQRLVRNLLDHFLGTLDASPEPSPRPFTVSAPTRTRVDEDVRRAPSSSTARRSSTPTPGSRTSPDPEPTPAPAATPGTDPDRTPRPPATPDPPGGDGAGSPYRPRS